jgi:hypothetical protein
MFELGQLKKLHLDAPIWESNNHGVDHAVGNTFSNLFNNRLAFSLDANINPPNEKNKPFLLIPSVEIHEPSSSSSLQLDDPVSPYQKQDLYFDEPGFIKIQKSFYLKSTARIPKSNSCSSLLIFGTPCNSDVKDMVQLTSKAVHDMILDSHARRCFRSHRVFSEEIFPLSVRKKLLFSLVENAFEPNLRVRISKQLTSLTRARWTK